MKIERENIDSPSMRQKWFHSNPQLNKKDWPKLYKSTVQGIAKGSLEPWEPSEGACPKCGGKGFTMERTTRPGRFRSITCDQCN